MIFNWTATSWPHQTDYGESLQAFEQLRIEKSWDIHVSILKL